MSYAPLPNKASFSDPSQLPGFLWMLEGNVTWLYNDGKGFPTIGIGLNLLGNKTAMAVVLNQMTYNGQTVFQAAAAQGISAQTLITTFENARSSSCPSSPRACRIRPSRIPRPSL
jgi:GH24 family phage-related lysozyme (muramidase)